MLSTTSRAVTRVRHPLKLRPVTVQAVRKLSPHVVRITFAGELADFVSASFDDHVKLMIPPPGARLALPTLGPDGPSVAPGEVRPVMRDYTPRAYDGRTLDLEVSLHGDGPVASWAAQVAVGDPAGIGGPKGSMIIPLDFDAHWLIGDESALPAIARRLEELPATARAVAVIEVSDPADRRPLAREVTWVARGALVDAVTALAPPTDDAYAWAAGEHHTMAAVRRALIEQHGFARDRVRVSAYWKQGANDHHAHLDD